MSVAYDAKGLETSLKRCGFVGAEIRMVEPFYLVARAKK